MDRCLRPKALTTKDDVIADASDLRKNTQFQSVSALCTLSDASHVPLFLALCVCFGVESRYMQGGKDVLHHRNSNPQSHSEVDQHQARIIIMPTSKTIVLFLFAVARVAQAATGLGHGEDLEALCKGEPINLIMRSDLDSLHQQATAPDSRIRCSAHIINCLKDLKLLLGDQNENVYTMEKAQKIKEFYYKHLDTSQRADMRQRLPESLRLFALAYLMQVSNACKRKLIDVLVRHAIENKDRPNLIDTQEEIAQFLESTSEQGDIFAPHQLGGLLPIETIVKRLIIRVKDAALAHKAKILCERRFKPVYGPAIMPLTVFASIGLNYREKFVKTLLLSEVVKPQMRYWSTVTFICELMEDLEVVGGGVKEGELEILTDHNTYQSTRPAQDASGSDSIERAESPNIVVSVPNRIYDKESEELVSAVETFNTDTHAELSIRKRFLEGIVPLLKSKRLQKPVKVYLSPELENIVHAYGKIDPELEATLTKVGTLNQRIFRTILSAVSSYIHRRSPESPAAISPLVLLIIMVIILSIVLGANNQ